MKVTKFIHSCLLVEHEGKAALIDPGSYVDQEGRKLILSLPRLDYLLITHEHQDHLALPLVKEIAERFPDIKITSNESVAKVLEGFKVSTREDEFVEPQDAPHEKIFLGPAPQNTLFGVFGRLTHPGDSLSFSQTAEVLALPVQAPWGSTTWAVERALELRPKKIVPIHDWHWSEEARKGMYARMKEHFAGEGIDFLDIDPGEEVVV